MVWGLLLLCAITLLFAWGWWEEAAEISRCNHETIACVARMDERIVAQRARLEELKNGDL